MVKERWMTCALDNKQTFAHMTTPKTPYNQNFNTIYIEVAEDRKASAGNKPASKGEKSLGNIKIIIAPKELRLAICTCI